jgi:diguanylate cyclase (GGDEF)-like protein
MWQPVGDDEVSQVCEAGGIVPVVQPIVRLSDSVIVGYEALARMRGPRDLAPDRWLDLADAAGRRIEMERACLEAVVGIGAPPADALLFVNASPALLSDPRVIELRASLPEHLVVELTEREAVDDYESLRAEVAAWQGRGVRLAIDDTGSGWSTLRHVVQLSPDFIKLDRSLVSGVDRDRNQRALVCALATFAREAGIAVIAEGVERREELEVLHDAGIDLAQGWLFAKAAPPWPPIKAPALDEVPERERARLSRARLEERLAAARDVDGACDVVAEHLARLGGIMPTVYLERDGLLRCRAQRGQWQVLDGMPPGAGVTGRTFLAGEPILLPDVRMSSDYLESIPGVVSEFCAPIRVPRGVIGALNVESFTPLTAQTIAAVRNCATALGRCLAALDETSDGLAHERLARHAARLAELGEAGHLGPRVVDAAIDVSGMDSAAIAVAGAGVLTVTNAGGPLAPVLLEISERDLTRLSRLVEHVTSCYTAGDSLGAGFVGTESLRAAGARSVVVVPLVAGGRRLGLVLAASRQSRALDPSEVETIELLAVHAATCLDNAALVESLRERTQRDPLTGLRNYSAFHDQLDLLLEARPEFGPNALLMADIDRFKDVNDTEGHLVGDQVLCGDADAIRDAVRPGDEVFRLGGDEFAVIVVDADDSVATRVAARVVEASEQHLARYGAGLSVGVALTNLDVSRTDVIEQADRALYRAKRQELGVAVASAVDGHEQRLVSPAPPRPTIRCTPAR